MTWTTAPAPRGEPSVRLSDTAASSTTSEPTWRTWTFCAGRGRMRRGASGGPFLPQPRPAAIRDTRTHGRSRFRGFRDPGRRTAGTLQDVAAQILVLHDVDQHPPDIGVVDRDLSLRHLGGLE